MFSKISVNIISILIGFFTCFIFLNNKASNSPPCDLVPFEIKISKKLKNIETLIAKRESSLSEVSSDVLLNKLLNIETKLESIQTEVESFAEIVFSMPSKYADISKESNLPKQLTADNKNMDLTNNTSFDMPTVMSWMDNLSKEKLDRIGEVFQWHAAKIREEMAMLSDEDKANDTILNNIMTKNDAILQEQIGEILDDEEFQAFLDSLPK